jgi:hypothetical protein
MSTAKQVKDIEPSRLDWLTIEDDTGRVWRYRRLGTVDVAEIAQVEGHLKNGRPIRANLIRDNDGHPLLRQNAPGLPSTTIVEYIDDPSNLYLTALGLPGKAQYMLVA